MTVETGEAREPERARVTGTEASSPGGAGPPAGEPATSLRSFFVMWGGQALSLVGSQAVQFALVWWLTLETGSPAILATATFVALAPQILLGPVAGALVDRWNRRLTMLLADAGVAGASAVLAALFLAGRAEPSHVLALLLVRSLGSAFHGPAMMASTSLMVPHAHLTRIQGLNQALRGGLNIISAPVGAILFASLSMPAVMAVDVVTALFAIIPLLFIAVPEPDRSSAAPGSPGRGPLLWKEMGEGLRYLMDRRGHLSLVVMASMINLCLVPAFSLLPLLVKEHLGGDALRLGWLTALFGAGSLAGGVLLGAWGGTRRRILTSLGGVAGLGLATVAVGAIPSAWVPATAAALFLVGFTVPLANGPIQAVMQATIAPAVQGRVFTLMGSLSGAMAPLGLLLAAPIAELLGVRFWYLAGGGICLLMGVAALFVRAIVEIEEASPVPGIPRRGGGEDAVTAGPGPAASRQGAGAGEP